ncbi:MAG TPA: 30S ribosomal protein S12 methylthiotransferase RimO [Candidatus Tripitaka californicus]|uniref:30S ribosomal protein S12 methylthiotransferase RimO n=1 Tax=Candidatus Tripitaka californicus TaxID=3367616 RepID=UPI0040281679|nr:30S ribosomal protein S12 methylthiotransferase RimO [Planctomycetota bacterium]
MKNPKIALISLGCTKNLVDSEKILGRLAQGGASFCQEPEAADVLIINTCGFIKEAKEESVETILQMVRLKEARLKKLIVTGCLAERYQEELTRDIPEIDHVVGLENFNLVAEFSGLKHVVSEANLKGGKNGCQEDFRVRLTPRHYSYLKVSEGCNNPCSYCSIPSIRGPFKSRSMEEVLGEARELVSSGTKEINLIAQDSTLYGIDLYGRKCLHELLQRLSEIDDLRWIRLLYTHPAHFYPALINEIASNEKVVKYLDLPTQHINDKILARMGRGVNRGDIEGLIKRLREEVSGLFLRSTVIVGFPGEGEEEFQELLDFLEETAFERLGAFTYSKEEGTAAAGLRGHVSEKIKKKRLGEVMSLQQGLAFRENARRVGKEIEVLVEEVGATLAVAQNKRAGARPAPTLRRGYGRSYGDAPEVDGNVKLEGSNLMTGEFRRALVTTWEGYNLVARCLD